MVFKLVFDNPKNLSSSNGDPIKRGDQWIASNNSISNCLKQIKLSWAQKRNLAGLIQDWQKIAGGQLSSNCIPLRVKNRVLIVGASLPQWRQALLYNRPQLLEALNSAGYDVKEIRIQQYHQENLKEQISEKDIWGSHPSRTDIHGISDCKECGSPSPAGEIKLWGKCGFCRRKELSI